MATINFTVEDHSIRVDNLIELAQGSNNFDTCAFTFDSSWDGFTLYAVMYQNPKNVFKLPLDAENTRKIRQEVLQKDGWVYIGARGEKEDTDKTIATSMVVRLPVRKGAVNGNEIGQEMLDQSQYEYLLGKVNELNEKCESLTKELEEDISQLSEEKVNNPPTGAVGQILEIETVDESGKPKTYKAVNKPSGSGEVTDEQISNAVDNYMAANPIEETDPTVPDWAKQPEKPIYTASEVGADASGSAENKVSEHNVATDAHNDIRLLIDGLTTKLNALADSDDTTLDQMSEVVAYIKSNKSLIDAITTSKVSVSDIIDNLTTNVANKPLSAAQGVALKALIDGITIPEKLPNPQKLTFAGAVTAEYDGSGAVTVTIPEGSGGSGGTIRIEKLSTDTAVELEPNKLYVFPEMAELTLTLAEPAYASIANEYHVVFRSGATATTLTIPDTVKISSGFTVDASKIYEISILEGCLCAQSWAVS